MKTRQRRRRGDEGADCAGEAIDLQLRQLRMATTRVRFRAELSGEQLQAQGSQKQ